MKEQYNTLLDIQAQAPGMQNCQQRILNTKSVTAINVSNIHAL
jgi:hypothetical protein